MMINGNESNKKIRRKFWLSYCIIFLLISFLRFLPMFSKGLTTIRNNDALSQYLYTLIYLGEWLRDGVGTLFSEGCFSFPMWDMSIGMGQDVITTLHYYGFTDPLSLFSVFFNKNNTWVLFEIIQFLKIFGAGIVFAKWCFYHKKPESAVLLGTCVYIFCGWTTVLGLQFIQFLTPLFYFPLILLGVDKIYKEKKYIFFIVSLALAAITNFYFLYMLCFFTFFYIVWGYFVYVKSYTVKHILVYVGKFMGSALLAMGIAAVVLLPIFGVVLQSQRINSGYVTEMVFDLIYYVSLPSNLLSFNSGFGIAAVAFFAIYFMCKDKQKRSLLAILVFFAVMLCIPFMQKAVNGFSYVSERWGWAWVIFGAYLCVLYYDKLLNVEKRDRVVLLVLLGMLVGLKMLVLREIDSSLVGITLTGVVVCLLYGRHFTAGMRGKLVITIALGTAVLGAWEVYNSKTHSMRSENYVAFTDIADAAYNTHQGMAYKSIDQEGYRMATTYDATFSEANVGLVLGSHGISHSFSLTPGVIPGFYSELWLNAYNDFNYEGFESKAELNALFSVKYIVGDEKDEFPSFYEKKVKYENGDVLWENKAVLPLTYAYDTCYLLADFDKLEPEDKQAVMLQAAVVDKCNLPTVALNDNNEQKAFTVKAMDNVVIKDNGIGVFEKDAVLELTYSGTAGRETYFKMSDIEFIGDAEYADITLMSGDDTVDFSVLPRTYYLSSGKDDFMCNLGYSDDARNSIKIVFHMPGSYRFDKMEIIEQDIDEVYEKVSLLAKSGLEDYSIIRNSIKGDIKLNEDKILCVAVPYSEGWTCYVNGVKQPVLKVNQSMLGVFLEKGEYSVEFKYITPLLVPGVSVTCASIVVLILLVLYEKKKRRI